jgi:hypothetical protein
LTAVGFNFRVRIIKVFMRTVSVRFNLMWKAEDRSQDLQQKWTLFIVLIFLTSFAERPQYTRAAVFSSTVGIEKRKFSNMSE